MLQARTVTVCRDGKNLLDAVSCPISAGKLTVILGPNGAGKTSLLRVLSGEWVPDSGSVWLHDKDLKDWKPNALAKTRAVLGQESHLRFAFSVRDVVLMGRLPYSPEEDTPRDIAIADAALLQMDVLHLAERSFPTLSGGEKQRIHLARVWAQIAGDDIRDSHYLPTPDSHQIKDSRFLLLDEPTNNLDLAHQFALMNELKALAACGIGVVAVLHDLNLTAQFADEVILLHQGSVVGVGSPCEVLTAAAIETVFALKANWVSAADGFGPLLRLKA